MPTEQVLHPPRASVASSRVDVNSNSIFSTGSTDQAEIWSRGVATGITRSSLQSFNLTSLPERFVPSRAPFNQRQPDDDTVSTSSSVSRTSRGQRGTTRPSGRGGLTHVPARRNYGPNAAYGDWTTQKPGNDVRDGLTRRFEVIERAKAKPDAQETFDITIRDLKVVGSYNWLDVATPTIIIPGTPGIWNNIDLPVRLPSDLNKTSYIDQHTHRLPACPLEPLVQAVRHLTPDFDFSSVDIVTDRNNLRKLLRWVSGDSANSFRMGAEIAGSTESGGGSLLLTRWEAITMEPADSFHGWGHSFVSAATEKSRGCEDTTAYHQVVTYEIGGLRILVRFAADAQLPTSRSRYAEKDGDIGELATMMMTGLRLGDRATEVSTPRHGKRFARSKNLHYVRSPGATCTPHDSLIEIKTRSILRPYDLCDIYPQLFFSQTEHLYIARHSKGEFLEIEKHRLHAGQLAEHGKGIEGQLKRLIRVLEEMKDITDRAREKGKGIAFVCDGQTLEAWEVTDLKERKLLDSGLAKLFARDR